MAITALITGAITYFTTNWFHTIYSFQPYLSYVIAPLPPSTFVFLLYRIYKSLVFNMLLYIAFLSLMNKSLIYVLYFASFFMIFMSVSDSIYSLITCVVLILLIVLHKIYCRTRKYFSKK